MHWLFLSSLVCMPVIPMYIHLAVSFWMVVMCLQMLPERQVSNVREDALVRECALIMVLSPYA